MTTNIYEVSFKVEIPEKENLFEVNKYIDDKLSKMFSDNPEMLNMFDVHVRDLHRGRITND